MALRLVSGSMTSSSASRKRSAAFTCTRSTLNWRRNVSSTCSDSPDAHEAGVDEDARELVADGLVHEGGGHRRVDAARQPAQHPLLAHLGPDLLHLGLDDRRHGPGGGAPAHVVEEVLEHLLAPGRVGHLGVELDAVDAPLGVLQGGHRHHVGAGGDREAGRRLHDRVAVAHPHVLGHGQVGEEGGAGDDVEAGAAVLGHVGAGHDPARAAGRGAGRRSRCPGSGRRRRRRRGRTTAPPQRGPTPARR